MTTRFLPSTEALFTLCNAYVAATAASPETQMRGWEGATARMKLCFCLSSSPHHLLSLCDVQGDMSHLLLNLEIFTSSQMDSSY